MIQKIVSTGGPVPWHTDTVYPVVDNGFLAPVTQVGGGLIDAWKILGFSTSVSFERWALNDTRYFSRYHSVDIRNDGPKPVTYTFSLQPAGGFELMPPPDNPWMGAGLNLLPDIQANPLSLVPTVKFPSGKFTVQPGTVKKAE